MKYLCSILMVSILICQCSEDTALINPAGTPIDTTKKSTNPFIGTWVDVFDTLPDAQWSKEEKIRYWYIGDFSGWVKPDTIVFNNDSVMNFGTRYWYDSSCYYITALVQYKGIKYDTMKVFYKFVGKDSLYYNINLEILKNSYLPAKVRVIKK